MKQRGKGPRFTRELLKCAENTLTRHKPDTLSQCKKTGRETIPTDPKFKQNAKYITSQHIRAMEETLIPPRHCDVFSTSVRAKAPAHFYQDLWLHKQAAPLGHKKPCNFRAKAFQQSHQVRSNPFSMQRITVTLLPLCSTRLF